MTPSDPHQPDPLTTHIDRTLHALAHPSAPEGLNHRLLATLATHQAAAPTPSRLYALRHPVLAAAALLLLVVALRLTHHPHPQPAATPPPILASQPTAELQPPTPAALPAARPCIHLQLALQAAPPTAPSNPDQQAFTDLHTPSFPAPPLPPTPQERLVRLMLRRGEIHNLAQLNPAELAARTQAERVDFHNFFEPPPPPVDPAPPATEPTTNPQNHGDPQ